ncbi:HPP family protein-like protein [Tricladium varicosporioides]|nr:HPP family protein-like protein [Hymenoscyphus varicosporioides]
MSDLTFNFDVDRYINPFIPRPRVHLLPKPVSWLLGHRAKPPRPIGNVVVWFWSFIGAFCGLLAVEAVFRTAALKNYGTPVIIASLGAAAILEYNTIESPLAQPRNAVLGQIFAAIIGVAITKLFQLSSNFEDLRWIAGALAVGLSSAFMGLTKTIHPPAGATALLAATTPDITELGWFLVPLVTLGSSLMIGVACVVNNIQRQFPMYWWTPVNLSAFKSSDIEALEENDKDNDSNSRKVSYYELEGHKDSYIRIDSGKIVIPSWMSLEADQRAMLEILRSRLDNKLRPTGSRSSDETHVHEAT